MQIGPIETPAGAALAPMAGVTDHVMRDICARHGAAFTVSEMVSAIAISMGDKKSLRLLRGRGGTAPYGVQLFGARPDILAEAVAKIDAEDFDFLDLNLGCPAHKIVAGGAGSALLKDPAKAEAFVAAAVKASRRPVTVKLRIGWDEKDIQGPETAKRCEAAGAALLCVHGRTRAEMYQPGVHYDAVAAIKAAVSIPVLFNGDIQSGENALAAMAATGADGVMIGRAAMGNPFLFAEVAAALRGKPAPTPPTLQGRFALLDEQVRAMCEEAGEEAGMRRARGVAAAYMKSIRGAASLRHEAHSLTYYADLARLVESAYIYNSEKS